MSSFHNQLRSYLRSLPFPSQMICPRYLGLKIRKELIKILRVRSNPIHNPFLLSQTQQISSLLYIPSGPSGSLTYDVTDYYSWLETEIFPSDILTSTLMMLARNYTLNSEDWYYQELENRRESFYKELGASQSEQSPPTINYRALFGLDIGAQVSDYCIARPDLQRQIRSYLDRWKQRCSEQIFYPKTSRKSMGVLSSWDAIELYDLQLDFGSKISTEVVEWWYWRTGKYPGGPCEMRQAWFYNDLTPRTYYATGAGVHRVARFSQRIFNLLLDTFPFTHRFKRFKLDRLELDTWETAIVYDYSSFTSRLSEHKRFVLALADFCKGTSIRLVDGPYGIVEWDLGDYLLAYHNECMDLVEFSLSPELAEMVGEEGLRMFKHQVASLLGINGNLASATALHGLYLCHLCGSMSKCSCVGDDAIGIFEIRLFQGGLEEGEIEESKEEKRYNIIRGLQQLGQVHSEKSKFLRPVPEYAFEDDIVAQDRWTYLKRSLDRFPTFLELGFLPAIPNIQVVIQEERTTRRMNFDASDPNEMIPRVASQCFNLVRSHFNLSAWGDEETQASFALLTLVYQTYELPRSGWFFIWNQTEDAKAHAGNLSDITFLPAIGRSLEDFRYLIRSDPMDHLIKVSLARLGEDGILSVPEIAPSGTASEAPDAISYKSTGGPAESFAVKVGVMKRRICMVDLDVENLAEYMSRFMSRHFKAMYEFTILDDCPDWLVDLLRG